MTTTITCNQCQPVFYKHQDGWDIYRRADCDVLETGQLMPKWFDGAIVEDAPTKAAAKQELASLHILGMCLA